MPKNPTPQGISRLLKTAGFERSVSTVSRVRGRPNRSDGFVVRGLGPGIVQVYHETSFRVLTAAERARPCAQQDRYAAAIEAAGYAVQRGSGGYSGPVVVTALTGESLDATGKAQREEG